MELSQVTLPVKIHVLLAPEEGVLRRSFVIGAGAEAGLPIGSELIEQIREKLKFSH